MRKFAVPLVLLEGRDSVTTGYGCVSPPVAKRSPLRISTTLLIAPTLNRVRRLGLIALVIAPAWPTSLGLAELLSLLYGSR